MRIKWSINVAERSNYIAGNSLFECLVDRQLLEEYGLYMYREGLTDEDIKNSYLKYLSKNLDCKAQANVNILSSDITVRKLCHTEDGRFDNESLVNSISYIMGIDVSDELREEICESFERVEKVKEDLGKCYSKMSVQEDNNQTFYLKIDSMCLEGIEFNTTSDTYEKIYSDRFSNEIDDNWSKTDWNYQQSYIVSKNRGEESLQALTDVYGYLCGNIWFKFPGKTFRWAEGTTVDPKLYVSPNEEIFTNDGYVINLNKAVTYMLKHFGTFYENGNNNELNAQLEYVQFGKKTDRENVRCMLEEIYKYRFASNLTSLMNSGKVKEENLVELAQKEAEYDVVMLSKGKSVKSYKEYKDFQTTAKMTDQQIINKAISSSSYNGTDGVCYKDYVIYGLYHVDSFEMIYSRIIDLVSYEMKSNLKYRNNYYLIITRYNIEYTPTSIAGLLGLINDKNGVETEWEE